MTIRLPIKKLFDRVIDYLKKICAVSAKQVIFIILTAAIISTAIAGYSYLVGSHYRSMGISLNYDGAQYGLTPSRGRFDINQIKSDEVISAAIEKTGDKSLTVENVRPRITIDANTPRTTIDKTISEISGGQKYSYTPAEFIVYYSQKKKFGKNYTTEFLKALAESYKDYFSKTYSDKNVILDFTENDEYEGKDYDEVCQMLSDKANSMINYLGQQQSKGSDFISNDTGYKYSELITSIVNIRDINIEKLNAYVLQNHVSKDKVKFLDKKKHLIDSHMRNYDYLSGASRISNESLSIYDARISGIAFVPTVDEENEFYMSRTKTGIDNLSKTSYSYGKKATNLKKTIDDLQKRYDGFFAAPQSDDQMHKTADEMIDSINSSLNHVSELAVRTDNEFIIKKNNNYLSVSSPKEYSLPIFTWFSHFVLLSIIFTIGIRFYGVLVRTIVSFANKENTNNEFKAD
mgnify:CR=1 FL=1